MLKTALLLSPVYVTFFWFILLVITKTKNHHPKQFLGVFMGASTVVYLSHFLFFSSLIDAYYWIDPLYQFASLLVFPLYHIYFRLLTIKERVSLRHDGVYLVLPTLLFLLYLSGFLSLPAPVFKEWLNNQALFAELPGIQFMNVIKQIIPIVFVIQAIYALVVNFWLIKTYRDKAEQYYSDLQDTGTKSVLMLNTILVITTLSSIVLSVLGKDFFKYELTGLALASFIFSTTLFLIGWLGYKQKSVNPNFEKPTDSMDPAESLSLVKQRFLLEGIAKLFDKEKLYLNSNLTIQDVALAVGTNRTYVSAIINQSFNLNFCRFVNEYRIASLETMLAEHPDYSYTELAEKNGFGSVDSMKRAIQLKSNLSFSEWRQQKAQADKGRTN
jgi:AraC-like DNA-binding protein